MIAMIFEVWPNAEHEQDYLALAAELRSLVDGIDGFISIERFESLYEPGKILSLGFFESEAALTAWRNTPEHRHAQALGREGYFCDYRLSIAEVRRRYSMHERVEAPADSRSAHGN
jgi:heme-degrading monooxygenase HmoA